MQTIIEKILEKFKGEIEEFFTQDGTSIEQAEEYFVPRVSQVVAELISAYYEQIDHALLEDRQGRTGGPITRRKTGRTAILWTRSQA